MVRNSKWEPIRARAGKIEAFGSRRKFDRMTVDLQFSGIPLPESVFLVVEGWLMKKLISRPDEIHLRDTCAFVPQKKGK